MKKVLVIFSLLFVLVSCTNNNEVSEKVVEEKDEVSNTQEVEIEENEEESPTGIVVEFTEDINEIKNVVDTEKDFDTAIEKYEELLEENPDHQGLKEGLDAVKKTSEFNEGEIFKKIDDLIVANRIIEAESFIKSQMVKYPEHQGLVAALKDLDNYR